MARRLVLVWLCICLGLAWPARAEPYHSGDRVQVFWEGVWYPAQVVHSRGTEYRIRYDGYDAAWDEWVGPDRIRPPQGAVAVSSDPPVYPDEYAETARRRTDYLVGDLVQIQDHGTWSQVEVIQRDGDRRLVHFPGFDASWNRWVAAADLRYIPGMDRDDIPAASPNPSLFSAGGWSPGGHSTTPPPPKALQVLARLGEKAPDLARELGRLPDLADGVDPKEIAGLEAIHQSYSGRPDAWARVFEAMNRVGLPDRRRYLAPLQALFWRAQDGGAAALNRMVDGYDLTRLLDQAWKPDPRRGWKDFDTVADRLQAPELAAWYLKHRFSYQWDAMDRPRDDRTTFQKGGGVCRHWASFATHCLIRNGYLAKNLTVWWDVDDHRGHTVTVIRRPEGLYVAADSTRPGIYDGPFADYMAVGESLTKERITAYKLETNTGLYQSDVDIYGE